MKILSAEQIREVDRFTIQQEQISSLDLMERAAGVCCTWLENNFEKERAVWIFCGPGNNGGDGLAMARILLKSGYSIRAFILGGQSRRSDDFLANESLLRETDAGAITELNTENDFPFIPEHVVLVDALFGTGLSKPIEGLAALLVVYLNDSGAEIISIDLPSGLFPDQLPAPTQQIVRATHTLSFQLPKFSFLFPSSDEYIGQWHLLKIGLNQKFIEGLSTNLNYISQYEMQGILKPRKKFSHKGNYGHALLISGSKGKIGAAVIAASACLRSGVGLLSVQVPKCGVSIVQTVVPEAMVIEDRGEDTLDETVELLPYNAVALGPGTGTGEGFKRLLEEAMQKVKFPLILDADALNTIAYHPEMLKLVPVNSILTPHVKEFDRLAGIASNDSDRHLKQKEFSIKYKVIVVLKGAHTCITSPDGRVYFNSTGNPGMAKGGCGDALTGILLGLLAQGYSPIEAAQLGVFLHGLAGDVAMEEFTANAMTAMDLVGCLPDAFAGLLI